MKPKASVSARHSWTCLHLRKNDNFSKTTQKKNQFYFYNILGIFLEYYPNFPVLLLLSVLHTRISINMTNVRVTFGVLVNTNNIFFLEKKYIGIFQKYFFFGKKSFFGIFPNFQKKKKMIISEKILQKKILTIFQEYSKKEKIVYRYKYQNFVEIFLV